MEHPPTKFPPVVIARVLRAAADRLEVPGQMCRNNIAERADGLPCGEADPAAAKWDAMGAINLAAREENPMFWLALSLACRAQVARQVFPGNSYIPTSLMADWVEDTRVTDGAITGSLRAAALAAELELWIAADAA